MFSPSVSYAAHRLRLGSYLVSYPRVWQDDQGNWYIQPFESETARTVFVSGEIRLEHDRLPIEINPSAKVEEISIEACQRILDLYRDWRLILP